MIDNTETINEIISEEALADLERAKQLLDDLVQLQKDYNAQLLITAKLKGE